jgi:ribosomal protein L17
MAASLILHERVITTTARAKALAPLINKIYMRAIPKDKKAYAKVHSMVRIKSACYKLFNNILDRYT